jgi:hypothetical protein
LVGCHAVHTKLSKNWLSHSEVNRRDTHIGKHRQESDNISLLLSFQNKESTLKTAKERKGQGREKRLLRRKGTEE